MPKQRSKRKVHGGIRLDEMLDESFLTAAPVSTVTANTVFKKTVALKLAYTSLPQELYSASILELAPWSMIVQDKCLIQIARNNSMRTLHNSNQEASDGITSSLHSASKMAQNIRQNNCYITKLNIHGAEFVTDRGLKAIADQCCTIEELNIGRVYRISDTCLRLLCTTMTKLVSLNLSYLTRATGQGLVMVGQYSPCLKELNIAGCKDIPEWTFIKIASNCSNLVVLDMSYCPTVSDSVLKAFAISCTRLQKFILKGCRQVSDVGLLSISSNCSELIELNLTRWNFQYKITDIGLLSLSERCQLLQSVFLSGCDMITDVGVSWLSSNCPGIVTLDMNKCNKISDIGLRAISEGLLKIKILKLQYCQKITDVGLRYLSLGCSALETIDVQGIAHISDGSSGEYGIQGLPAIAKSCHALQTLNLTSCFRVSNHALLAISNHCTLLQHIYLSYLPNLVSYALLQLFRKCKKIKTIHLNESSGVNDAVLHAIAKNNMLLTSLHLRKCKKISNGGVSAILHACPSLQDLNLEGCTLLTDFTLLSISEAYQYPGLNYLNLSGLDRITAIGVSWLAQKCTFLLLLNLTGCSIHSSSIKAIQSAWKYSFFRKDEKFTGFYPKPRAKDRLFIDEYGKCWKSATKIQNLYRAKLARRKTELLREETLLFWVATKLQSVYRGRQARRFAWLKKMQKQSDQQAAITIQRFCRKMFKNRLDAKQNEMKHQRALLKATIDIQCAWRQKKARGSFLAAQLRKLVYEQKLQDAAIELQRVWRGKSGRKQYHIARAAQIVQATEQSAAAQRIQMIFRGREARQATSTLRKQNFAVQMVRHKAASLIQRYCRGRNVRKLLNKKRVYQARLLKATLLIQRRWRMRKCMLSYKLLSMKKRIEREETAVRKLQCAWRKKQGYFAQHLIQSAKDKDYVQRDKAACSLQRHWRAKKNRDECGRVKTNALEYVLAQSRKEYKAASRLQARYRGWKGRSIYQQKILEKKRRWKEVYDAEKDSILYYNLDTGEVRYRMPQDILDLLPKPICNNCEKANSITECKDCGEHFCEKCHVAIHSGGKRKMHVFRTFYDYYGKRMDYGDAEFPSKWPSEIEHDEMNGWFLRKDRIPNETIGEWEQYIDVDSGRIWYYNTITKVDSYSTPTVFEVIHSTDNDDDKYWIQYYDDTSQQYFYYNSKTNTSTFTRPTEFSQEEVQEEEWIQYFDEESQLDFYYNTSTGISTYSPPSS